MVDLLQIWTLIGIPVLVMVAALFVGMSRWRAAVGYLLLVALAVVFFLTPGGGSSAAVVGAILIVLVAVGRGTGTESGTPQHHEQRSRFTTAGT